MQARFTRRISACHKIHVFPQDSVFLTKSNLSCGFLFLFYCSIFCFFFYYYHFFFFSSLELKIVKLFE